MKAIPQFRVRKTYEEVAEYLKEQIVSGVYQPGDRLPSFRELGEMLGVGQSTVREAVGSLKTIGLVVIRQGEGTFVSRYEPEKLLAAFEMAQTVTKQDIIDLLEVRMIIETGIVRLAAERRTDADLKKIEEVLREMEDALEQEHLGDQADWKFHYSLSRAAHNAMLESVMQSISETMSNILKASHERMYQSEDSLHRLHVEHKEIYLAVKNSNPKRAEETMLHHLLGVKKQLVK
ncbi:FadR/GntR family transcriptional regulator [Brevibacillus ginsengisoli]|uniref:FadR/GntR family transcriptional regulator n=1 Tax=Brevibacillus ginsengisoli TaxID=363854 RepID=UPI003CF6D57B